MSTVKVMSHAGDLGDLLAHLSTVRQLADKVELVLYPAPGMVREPWTPAKVERVRSFLLTQEYVEDVRYSEYPEGLVLDTWRQRSFRASINLSDIAADTFGVPHWPRGTPWCRVDRPERVAAVVIHRSERYPGRKFPWSEIVERWGDRAVMVGSPDEHREFCKLHGEVRHYPTPTLLELGRVVGACELYCGNQSAPYWVAVSLGVRTWLEQGRPANCNFRRPGAWYDGDRTPFSEIALI